MTTRPDVVFLADHSVLLAIPAFAPAFVVAGVVIFIAMRDRRQGDEPHNESSGPASEDRTP
jgi:hypothetical protein